LPIKKFVIIDEISMVDAVFLGKISSRLSEITHNNASFGGKNVILVGDFFQLPPVGGDSLDDLVC